MDTAPVIDSPTDTTAPPRLLSARDILAAKDLNFHDVDVPEWGGIVRLQALSAADVLKFVESNQDAAQRRTGDARLVAMCAADALGQRLFSDEEVLALLEKSFTVVNRLAVEAMKVNGLDQKKVDAEKNASGAAAPGDSPTA